MRLSACKRNVILRLPPPPKTTNWFLKDSVVADSESVVSSGADSTSGVTSSSSVRTSSSSTSATSSGFAGSTRTLSCDVSSDAVPPALASCSNDELVGSVRVPGYFIAAPCISGSAGVSSNARSSSSSSCVLSGEVQVDNCSLVVLPDSAVELILRHLPIKDVFRLGFVLSRRWRQIWLGMPLTIHDAQLVPDSMKPRLKEVERISLHNAQKVTAVLDRHPGPVEVFRVDHTTWRGGSSLQWHIWIEKLINRNVKEVIMLGRWPIAIMDVLPNNLVHCRSLVTLHLCFFTIPKIADTVEFPFLKKLQLSHCSLNASDLDFMLHGCNILSELTLGFISFGVLQLRSDSLKLLRLWKCSIDYLCLSGTPVLRTFSQEPARFLNRKSHIQIRQVPNLQRIHSLYLNQQTVEVCGYSIKAHMTEYPQCLTVTLLGLAVNFSSPEEVLLIPCLLKCFPNLKGLWIYRLDPREVYEGPLIDWQEMLSNIPCVQKRHLNRLGFLPAVVMTLRST